MFIILKQQKMQLAGIIFDSVLNSGIIYSHTNSFLTRQESHHTRLSSERWKRGKYYVSDTRKMLENLSNVVKEKT